MREVELSGDYERSNVELVEVASAPRSPIRPRKARGLMMTAMLGCLLAISIPLLLEYLDDTIRTPEELEERVGVNVLGFVPHIARRGNQKKKHAHRLVVMEEPDSSAIEAYRNIRTSLMFIAPAEEVRTILITSGGPGDGKTTTACNLAAIMASSGKRILLVDMDMRRPTVHRVFGMENETGLTNLLVGEAEFDACVQKGRHGDKVLDMLDVMTAGTRPPNPTELIEAKATRKLIETLSAKYDRIIIDSPPVLFVADASLISTFCDGVVLVARSAKNARSQALRARRQLDSASARILGGILNDVTRWSQFYSEYYYYGYSRYYKDYYTAYYSENEDESTEASERTG
ncbi:MAG: polysaccharide biosynthesis tyrosine autokinase [Verrucomicrobia bacterium]|nr:polysaccharide biosynthesis tyrosine autokinase [Verrucomicrobiota bacterium]MDA1087222.1 polysaccharide biosynthesis tyrosine autokinase [Verrucomicrobiota bacterium]